MHQIVNNVSFSSLPNYISLITTLSISYNAELSNAQAIYEIVNEIFIKRDIKFNIAISDEKSNFIFDNLLDGMFKNNKLECSYKLQKNLVKREKFPTLFLINEIHELQIINEFITAAKTNYSMPLRFLIYCRSLTINNFRYHLKPLMPLDRKYWIDNSEKYFIIENDQNMTLLSYFISEENIIGNNENNFYLKLEIAAIFDRINLRWFERLEKLEKKWNLEDMKGLKVLAFSKSAASYELYKDKVTNQSSGVLVDILNIVSQRSEIQTFYGSFFHHNLKATHSSGDLIPTIAFSSIYSYYDFANEYHLTTTFTEENYRLIITPPDSFKSYEKLVMPFDKVTWILLILTFLVAFIVIKIVLKHSKKIQNIIFGEKVCAPAYNVVGILFGIPQPSLPKNSFARFILIMFIIFCLIFRTAYVGVIFELLALDIQKPPPGTLLELIEENFTFYQVDDQEHTYINDQIENILKETFSGTKIKRKIKILTKEEFTKIYLDQYKNASAKLAFYADNNIMSEFNSLCKCTNLLLQETLFTKQVGLAIEKEHFLYNLIEETLQKIIPFGISQHSADYHKWVLYRGYKEVEKDEPSSYSLADLSFVFILWTITCGISFFVFCYEFLSVKFKHHSRELLGLILLSILLYQRLKTFY
ncbi:hypothetical protein PVAND_002092 [Polypedilum vanderplanki]|uniref:Ionotropic receptor n=1 Tax=Polypedilum vanderplanki TaxID=319348 RepID=A0A9J6BPY2_POLVA|nr:hypothetical protein PVAND_002092 [Polypedilum vanderplanki]